MLLDQFLQQLLPNAQQPAPSAGPAPLPGSPQAVNPMDLASIIGQLGQGGQASGPAPMAPAMTSPDPQSQPGYMGVGAGLAGNLPNEPKRTPLPPPETEPTAPTGMLGGSSISTPASSAAKTPDFSPSLSRVLSNVGDALQGRKTEDLGREELASNETYRALVGRGLSPNEASAAVRNPTVLAAVLPALFNPNKSLTDDQREYDMARHQGYTGSFLDYQKEVKRAGSPQFSVTTDMRAENAEAKGRGEGLSKRLNGIAEDGTEAQKDLVTLNRLSLLTKNVDPGTKTALLEEIRNATGITLDPNTDNVQAFKAATSYLAPRMRVTGSGSSSDRDVNIFFNALPSLLGTPDGNQLAITTLGGMAQNRIQRAEIAARWQRGELTASQADQAMKALPNPFAEYKSRYPEANQPEAKDLPVMTPEQAAKAPPGTRFKDSNGKVRVRQ